MLMASECLRFNLGGEARASERDREANDRSSGSEKEQEKNEK